MNAAALRLVYVGALLASGITFLFVARPLVGLLPWGKVQFSVIFTTAVALFFVGAYFEDRLLWKGRFTGRHSDGPVPARNPVPPIPLSIGAFVGILGSLYV